MAPVKIAFSDHSATPPVYVAGSFTEWQPVELEATQVEQGFSYEKTFDLTPGTYQFKFRLGPGDWWTCDSQATKTRDAAGNENNEIVVEAEPVEAPSVTPATPVVNSISKPDVTEAIVPAKPAATSVPEPVEVIEEKPAVVKTNGVPKSAPEPIEPVQQVNGVKPEPPSVAEQAPVARHRGVHEQVTSQYSNGKVEEPTQPKPAAPVVEEPAEPEPAAPVIEEPVVPTSTPLETEHAVAPKPAAPEAESNESTVSSLPAKEKTPAKPDHEPKKLGWFSRIFLCGSSRKAMLIAIVVAVPILAAYFIHK